MNTLHSTAGAGDSSSELIIVRIFNASRELVWKAWTEADRLSQWWGPKQCTGHVAILDFRIGGKVLFCMRFAEIPDIWTTGTFTEIVPHEKIVFTDSFADPEGNVVSASYYGMDSAMPLEMMVTVLFEEIDGNTKMTLRHAGVVIGPESDGGLVGWNESFDKLVEMLAGN